MNFKEFINFREDVPTGGPREAPGYGNDGASGHNGYNAGGAFVSQDVGRNGKDSGLEPSGRKGEADLDINIMSTRSKDMKELFSRHGGWVRSIGKENDIGQPTENPIPIILSDNTTLSLSWNEYKIIGQPKKGKDWKMEVCFLKSQSAGAPQAIQSIEVTSPNGKTKKIHNWSN